MEESNGDPVLQPTERTRNNPTIGKFRLPADLEPIEVTFILLAFVSIMGAAIITIVKLKESVEADKDCNSDCTFAILLLVNLVFVLIYTIYGVFCERPFELLVSVIATVIVMLYCVIEFAVNGHKDSGEAYQLKLGRLVAVLALGPVDIVLGCIIGIRFYRSKDLIFRTVGGNALLQSMCQTMFMFTAFLKFDFQLVITLLILVINGAVMKLGEKLILGLGVPLSFGWVIVGFIMVRYERMRINIIFWLFSILEPCYIIYLFVRSGKNIGKKSESEADKLLDICIIGGGVVALVVRGLLLIMSYFVTRNFGKGLKDKVFGNSQQRNINASPDQQVDYQSTHNDN